MAFKYKVELSNASGVKQAELTDFLGLDYVKRVNDSGALMLTLSGEHPIIQSLSDKWIVEVYISNPQRGLDWTSDWVGLFREAEMIGARPGVYNALALGLNSILDWRIVAWNAGLADRSEFISEKAETIMKTLVEYNLGSSATTGNGRLNTGTVSAISVQSDGAGGNTLNWYCHADNLLRTLQELAKVAGGDFDIVRTAAYTFQFRWYSGQLGTDRTSGSSRVLFSLDHGNMGAPYYRRQVTAEKTLAIVAGQGEGDKREYRIRQGDNYNVSTNNHELFVDARDIFFGDTDGLDDRGDKALEETKADEIFEFDVLQTPSSLYGIHYFLGDKVLAASPFSGSTLTRKINEVRVKVRKDGNTEISIGLSNE